MCNDTSWNFWSIHIIDFFIYDFILEKLNIFLTDFNFNDFIWIGVFILGILTGILTFSRFVKYLLNKHKNKTLFH